jgi:hypothetical protein
MKNLVLKRAWWPKMDQDIQGFTKSCTNCQIAQRQRPDQEREYAQLPTPRNIEPFQHWGIDLIGRLPETKDGNKWIITAIDYATGWPIAKALPNPTEEVIADFIFHKIYIHYGAPRKFQPKKVGLADGPVGQHPEEVRREDESKRGNPTKQGR